MILIIILYALLASTFTIGKAALSYFQPFFLIGIRMIAGGALLLAYLYIFNRKQWRFDPADWVLFVQTALFHIYFAFVCEFWALQYLTSSKACLLYNVSPFLTALLSYFWFSEVLTLKKFAGLCIGFIGFLPVLLTEAPGEQLVPIPLFSMAEIMLLASVVASVYGWILVRSLVKHRHYSTFMVNGIAMVFGGFLALLSSLVLERSPILAQTSSDIMIGLGYTFSLIIIANVIYYNLYGHLLRHYSATFLSFVGFICPLFAAFYGWLFLSESIGWPFFASVILVAVGLYLFYQEELRQGYVK